MGFWGDPMGLCGVLGLLWGFGGSLWGSVGFWGSHGVLGGPYGALWGFGVPIGLEVPYGVFGGGPCGAL